MTIYPDRIELYVKTKDENVHAAVEKLITKIQRTLDYCINVVEERTDYNITQERVFVRYLD